MYGGYVVYDANFEIILIRKIIELHQKNQILMKQKKGKEKGCWKTEYLDIYAARQKNLRNAPVPKHFPHRATDF